MRLRNFNPESGRSARRWRSVAALVSFILLFASGLFAQRPTEYAVKAAYILNFGRYVKWPAVPSGDFKICVLGSNPFGSELNKTVAGESLSGRPVAVQKIDRIADARGCQILFFGESERIQFGSELGELKHLPILTVSDLPDFLERGGIIQFELQGDRVRFSINSQAAKEAGLSVSSDLLKVATKVIER